MWAVWRLRIIVLVSMLAGLTQFELPLLRPTAAFIFLLVCPGAALLGFVKLSAVTDAVLSIALSIALLTLVAGLTVLLGTWTLEASFWSLLIVSLLSTAVQLFLRRYRSSVAVERLHS